MLDFPWDSIKPHDVGPIVERWEAMPETTRRQLQVILQDVNELGDERSHKVLTEEMEWRFHDKLEAFGAWKSLLDKALWAYLEARTAFAEAWEAEQ